MVPQRAFPPLLLVAHSARRLAASAARAGLPAHALDRFGDRDTRRHVAVTVVAGRDRTGGDWIGFDPDELLATAARVASPARFPGLVVGSGFEDDVETLRRLARGRELFGNRPELVALLKSPMALARIAAELRIEHPEFRFDPPSERGGWLIKRVGSTGGIDVREASTWSGAPAAAGFAGRRYFQRKVAGRALGVLFAADGERAMLLGAAEQHVRVAGPRPYLLAGASGPVALPQSARTQLARMLDRLVTATGLRGCNSADLIATGDDRFVLLEINPRPSATWDLYDADWPRGLLEVHLRACRGELPAAVPAPGAVRAFAYVFADREARAAGVRWPGWCSDLPGDAPIAPMAPVCTVHAEGRDTATAWRAACVRAASIESSLEVLG